MKKNADETHLIFSPYYFFFHTGGKPGSALVTRPTGASYIHRGLGGGGGVIGGGGEGWGSGGGDNADSKLTNATPKDVETETQTDGHRQTQTLAPLSLQEVCGWGVTYTCVYGVCVCVRERE